MKITRRNGLKLLGATALAASPLRAIAASHGNTVVEMLAKANDSNERFVFSPPVLKVGVGESVLFQATTPGHNSASNDDMLPDGADGWNGRIGQDIEVTFTVPGVYGYHCSPHRSAGMVGLVLVGDVTQAQLDAAGAVRHRGKAKARYDEYLSIAAGMI